MTWCGSHNLKSESICDNIVVYLVSQTWLLLVYALFLHLRLEGHLPKNNQVFAVERSNESNQPEFPKNCQDNANCKLSHAMKNELLAGVILYGHGHIWQKKNLCVQYDLKFLKEFSVFFSSSIILTMNTME